jgi:hypothetical protein
VERWAESISKRRINQAVQVPAPALLALTVSRIAQAQGTIDFSGAQTLMGTLKTLTASSPVAMTTE